MDKPLRWAPSAFARTPCNFRKSRSLGYKTKSTVFEDLHLQCVDELMKPAKSMSLLWLRNTCHADFDAALSFMLCFQFGRMAITTHLSPSFGGRFFCFFCVLTVHTPRGDHFSESIFLISRPPAEAASFWGRRRIALTVFCSCHRRHHAACHFLARPPASLRWSSRRAPLRDAAAVKRGVFRDSPQYR